MTNITYPLTAIVGQQELKLGLILNAINPGIGGVLIRGEKGTAKSTAVRGLSELLPELEVVSGCRFSCHPAREEELCFECRENNHSLPRTKRMARMVNLPLNATEDRVAGGIDFSTTIQTGKPTLQTGLLAEAHRAILYIDEVNLLDDHIVDLILDTVSSGKNVIEREGLSITHPARFILIGTMNPEEGELRPQFLDRFGLCIEVTGSHDIDERIRLLTRREEFDSDPIKFCARYNRKNATLRQQIIQARSKLKEIRVPAYMRIFISELCSENNVAGHRADLIMEQAARAFAALEGEDEVRTEHIRKVAPLVLIHRKRDAQPPPEEPVAPQNDSGDHSDQPEQKQDQTAHPEPKNNPETQNETDQKETSEQESTAQPDPEQQHETSPDHSQKSEQDDKQQQTGGDQIFEIGTSFKVKKITTLKDRQARRGSGRRSRSRVSQKQGRYSRASQHGVAGDIALDATIRAAAPQQANRTGSMAIKLSTEDFRFKIREKRIGNLLLFLVDASGSMGARGRMAASKGAIMSLLLDAYQKRDKVTMISFRRQDAAVNLPMTNSVELAGKLLSKMAVGGRTPLSAGLIKGYEQMRNYLTREPTGRPIIIILTDGKNNVSLGNDKPVDEMLKLAAGMANEKRAKYIVVDTEEEGIVTFGLAQKLAGALGADYFKIKDLQAEELVNIVQKKQ